jgi:Ca2+/Na+ antiporter
MNILQKLRLARRLSKSADEFEEGVKMKNATKIIGAVVGTFVAIVTASPDIQHAIAGAVSAHPAIAALVAGLSTILSLVHDPKSN